MEGQLRDIESPSLQNRTVLNLLRVLETSIDTAKDLRDRAQVTDPALHQALQVVEGFLRKHRRICYGGMAINAHLPKSKQFYDLTKVIPDYDFFTPSPSEDIQELLELLSKQGLQEPQARLGIHEGTTKIFVNYTAVADVTYLSSWKYKELGKKALEVEGIYYADSEFLRANLYLELSRPRGEVERWDKVYKRLLLLNAEVKPPKMKKHSKNPNISMWIHKKFIDYSIDHTLTVCSASVKDIYASPSATRISTLDTSPCPLVVYTNDPLRHCKDLRQLIRDFDTSIHTKLQTWAPQGDLTPFLAGIRIGSQLVCLCVDQTSCNSYNLLKLSEGRSIRIGSLDTCITLYTILQSVKGLNGLLPCSPECFANDLINISIQTRDRNRPGIFPAFSISCSGHQPTKASLLKAKASRIKSLKRKKVAVGSGTGTRKVLG